MPKPKEKQKHHKKEEGIRYEENLIYDYSVSFSVHPCLLFFSNMRIPTHTYPENQPRILSSSIKNARVRYMPRCEYFRVR